MHSCQDGDHIGRTQPESNQVVYKVYKAQIYFIGKLSVEACLLYLGLKTD